MAQIVCTTQYIKKMLSEDEDNYDESIIDVICGLSSSNCKWTTKKKRTRKKKPLTTVDMMKPPINYVLLPNGDFRYNYPKDMINYLTLFNFDKYRSIMHNYCSPDVKFIQEYDGPQNPYGPNRREFSGVDSIVDLHIAVNCANPDNMAELVDQIKGYALTGAD